MGDPMTPASSRRAAVLVAVVAVAACSKSTPAPSAIPTPAPTPVATPAPAGTPSASFVCPFPALPDLHNTCPKLTPELSTYVNNAVESVVAHQPQLFDFTNNLGDGSWKVLDRQKYVDAVVAAIHAQGVCAKDDNEEIAVKNSNSFHEQYNIYTSGGYVRRAYITTCLPAQF
jgi:hypothetical protein